MRAFCLLAAVSVLPAQQALTPRITPPTLNVVSPLGIARGTTAELTVEGLNLARASAVYFSEPSVRGKVLRVKELPDLPDVRLGSNGTPSTIDVGPLPPRNQVTLEVSVDAGAHVGPVRFRLLTPLGSSPEGSFLIEPYFGEVADREPNDLPDAATEAILPAVLAGVISRPGDIDHYKIQVQAGAEIVFENAAMRLGSALQPVVRILAEDQRIVREFGAEGGSETTRFSHRFEKAGTYYLRVSDYENSGRASNFYRVIAGQLPLVRAAYPLGLRRGEQRSVALTGYNLGAAAAAVPGNPSPGEEASVVLRPATPNGAAFNEVRLALGDDAEVEAVGTNQSLNAAQALSLPVTVNGRIPGAHAGVPSAHYYRFRAKKGQHVMAEVNARRLGSELDSLVEVLDAKGNPIERATVRATWETSLVLRDHDSASLGLRIQAWNVLSAGDYIMAGNEVLRVAEVPDGPDEDMVVEGFGGQRTAFFGTTSEAHGADRSVYKVQVHPPGANFSPNGLPLVRLYYRNDDGGPGFGKDSLVDFTAPADGDYILRLSDVRGAGGDLHAYRLNLREPRPDFRLSVAPRNLNVPRGGVVPLTVTAFRLDGYDGPIEVSLSDLPPGLSATKNTIAAGGLSATILVSADAEAKLDEALRYEVNGRARVSGREIAHRANPEDRTKLIALAPKPDIVMAAETQVVELQPGQTAEVKVRVSRHNGFIGRVPVQVRDLPSRVRVTDSGLNGVLITEDEQERSFKLWALPNAEPVEGTIYIAGQIETRSPQQNLYAAPQAVRVVVKPGASQTASGNARSADSRSATAPK
jgi:hypothetical protein